MEKTPTFDLYIDDSGSRHPDKKDPFQRRDGVDAFALGGYLVESERACEVFDLHKALTTEFGITYPLHAYKIRNRKAEFSWLDSDREAARRFFSALTQAIEALPGIMMACVVDRPGYNIRYHERYGSQRWMLCKSAYTILIERAAKFAAAKGRRLKVYLEETGPKDDKAIRQYHQDIIESGLYFSAETSRKYNPLGADDLAAVLMKNPKFVKKENPFVQFSDLVLFPMVKGRYDPAYLPYRILKSSGKLIDSVLSPEDAVVMGIKYYCFDSV